MITLAIALLLLSHSAKAVPWILTYHCDSGWGDQADDLCGLNHFSEHEKEFLSEQAAVDWINENYIFAPTSLSHGDEILPCEFTYLNAESDDQFTAHQKSTDCRLKITEPIDTIDKEFLDCTDCNL